jgi:uncharacterized protein (TIGR02996 family)
LCEEQFLAAIAAAPDDSHLKLVYADWLDEAGEGLRAAFLRGVVTGVYGDEWSELSQRVGRLWSARATGHRVGRGWVGNIPAYPGDWWDVQTDLGQSVLNALLQTYSYLNSKIDDVHSFDAVMVRNAGRWEDALAGLFEREHVPGVTLDHLDDWHGELCRVLDRWLQPSGDVNDRLWNTGRVVAAVYDVLRPTDGWRVRFNFPGWYAVEWDDLLLGQGDVGLLLHFGRSD